MIKYFGSIIIILLLATAASAQADSTRLKQQLLDTLCNCMSKKDTAAIKNGEDLQTAVMACFMTDGLNTFMDYAQSKGVDLNDEEGGRAIGQEIGKLLVVKCETFQKLMLRLVISGSKEDEKGSSPPKKD